MFILDDQVSWVQTRPEEILDIYTSINRSTVAPPGRTPEPAQAYIASIYQKGAYQVFIYLYLSSSNMGLLYRWSEGPVPPERVPEVYQNAFQFSESMGFMLDDMRYREKSAEEKAQTFAEVPMFHADLSFMKSGEPAEEAGESGEELVIEPLEESSSEVGEVEEGETLNLDVLGDTDELHPGISEPPPSADGVVEISLEDAVPAPAPKVELGGGEEEILLDSLEVKVAPEEVSAAPALEPVPPAAVDEQTQEGMPPAAAVMPVDVAEEMAEDVPLTPEEARVLGMAGESGASEAAGEAEVEEITMGGQEPATATAEPEMTVPPSARPTPPPSPPMVPPPPAAPPASADSSNEEMEVEEVEMGEAEAEPAPTETGGKPSEPLFPGTMSAQGKESPAGEELSPEDYKTLVLFLTML